LIIQLTTGREEIIKVTKPFYISKQLIVQAHKLVKANAGSAGVNQQSLDDFERNLKDNLYKIWNRMASGSYFALPVKAMPIPKKSGGECIFGVAMVSDRIAQMVVKLMFEPLVEPYFLPDSCGYRPNKSALDAVSITRQRCWQYDGSWSLISKGEHDEFLALQCATTKKEVLIHLKPDVSYFFDAPLSHLVLALLRLW
jgi:RNA-directed DNA polymerase